MANMRLPSDVRIWLLVVVLLMGPARTGAEALSEAARAAGTPRRTNGVNAASGEAPHIVDRWQQRGSRGLLRTVERIDWYFDQALAADAMERSRVFDRYFGDRSVADERTGSRLRLSGEVGLVEGEAPDFAARYSARLNLPRLRHRAQLIVDNLPQDEDVLEAIDDQSTRDNRFAGEDDRSARIQVVVLEGLAGRLSADAGLRFRSEVVPRFRLSGRLRSGRYPWSFRLRERVFWQSDDGFGEKTSLGVRRMIGRQALAGLSGSALWSETSAGVEFGITGEVGTVLTQRTRIGVRAAVAWQTRPDAVVQEYALRLPLHYDVYRDWLDLLIEPGINFPDELDYEAEWLVTVRLDFMFGDLH